MNVFDFRQNLNEKIKQLKVVEVKEDPASGGTKVLVTLEFPLEDTTSSQYNFEEFFRIDDIKRVAIKEATRVTCRATGWSDISRLKWVKNGEPVSGASDADGVQVVYTCLSAI